MLAAANTAAAGALGRLLAQCELVAGGGGTCDTAAAINGAAAPSPPAAGAPEPAAPAPGVLLAEVMHRATARAPVIITAFADPCVLTDPVRYGQVVTAVGAAAGRYMTVLRLASVARRRASAQHSSVVCSRSRPCVARPLTSLSAKKPYASLDVCCARSGHHTKCKTGSL